MTGCGSGVVLLELAAAAPFAAVARDFLPLIMWLYHRADGNVRLDTSQLQNFYEILG
jgi:hypothetical protein